MLIEAFDSRAVRVAEDGDDVQIEILSTRGGGWVRLTLEQATLFRKCLESAITKAGRMRRVLEKKEAADAKRAKKK